MNFSPNLAMDAEPGLIAAQGEEWAAICAMSSSINDEAHQQNWTTVMSLADQRETMVAEFFNHPLAWELLDTVMRDVEQMKAEHIAIIEAIAASDGLAAQTASRLHALRDQAAEKARQ